MLSSINFLFLLSLGFLSWTILCYIHQIEQFVQPNHNIPQPFLKEEIPVMPKESNSQVQTPPPPNETHYEIYVYLMCTLVCIYALVKVTHLAEMYSAKCVRYSKFTSMSRKTNQTCSTGGIVEDLENSIRENQNSAMKHTHDVFAKRIPESADLDGNIKYMYIINNYTQVNHDIDIDNRTIIKGECGKEMASVWEKYMKLQDLPTQEQLSIYTPVAMSQEEFGNIKGIF